MLAMDKILPEHVAFHVDSLFRWDGHLAQRGEGIGAAKQFDPALLRPAPKVLLAIRRGKGLVIGITGQP